MDKEKLAQLKERVGRLPQKPGVYLFKNESGEIIYIGKAVKLRNRVRSYFLAHGGHSPWNRIMIGQISDFEYLTTDSEREALTLETNLIKQHRPRFNILMRDDKNYLYVRISVKDEFPTVTTTRRVVSDGSRYFGPFVSEIAVKTLFRQIRLIFPFRRALEQPEKMLEQPALDYYVKRFGGSYDRGLDPQIYRLIIDSLIRVLEGNYKELESSITKQMQQAAEDKQFERAAALRDQLRSIRQMGQEQKIVVPSSHDQDVVGLSREGDRGVASFFTVRGGKVVKTDHYDLRLAPEQTLEEGLEEFLRQYYSLATEFPREILLSHTPTNIDEVIRDICQLAGRKVTLVSPMRGFKKRLVSLAERNATERLVAEASKFMADQAKLSSARVELAQALALNSELRRIECYDNSNLQGTDAVSSMAVFEDGKPKTSAYRRFKVKDVQGIDDVATMREILDRRFGRRQSDDESFSERPDLIIIDGGKGQVGAAAKVLVEHGLDIPIIGLAKREEEIFVPQGAGFSRVLLPYRSEAMYLVQRIRDEAHRFAITYHTNLRRRSIRTSALEQIPGVGPATRKKLLKDFGSLTGVKSASEEQLAKVIGPSLARRIKQNV
jgi:excinuclease ABC subunit C